MVVSLTRDHSLSTKCLPGEFDACCREIDDMPLCQRTDDQAGCESARNQESLWGLMNWRLPPAGGF
jgi:hypothetical protein